MAVEVTIGTGLPDSNLSGFTVTEASTPTDPSDTTGEIGHFGFGMPAHDEDSFYGKTATLTTDDGTVSGVITDAPTDRVDVTVSADTKLARLNVPRQVKPYIGTLGGAFTYYGNLVGLTIITDSAVSGRAVAIPGWFGNVWTELKTLCAIQKVELAGTPAGATVRPLRGKTLTLDANSGQGWTTAAQLAQTVEAYCYNTVSKTNTLVYPPGTFNEETQSTTPAGWTSDVQILQVPAYDTVTFDVPIAASLTSVQQPVCKKTVGAKDDTASVYTVMGKDGVMTLDPAVWTARGGKVVVTIGEDSQTLTIAVSSGSNEASLAPFRIAMSSGTDYSSLRIVGSGVFMSKEKISAPTGVPASMTSTEVGVTIDTKLIGTREQAYDALAGAAARFASEFRTYKANSVDVGQAINNIAGARVETDDSFYRVRTATTTQDDTSLGSEQDTLFSDHNTRWAGKTFADWNNQWADGTKTWRDYAAAPLRGTTNV